VTSLLFVVDLERSVCKISGLRVAGIDFQEWCVICRDGLESGRDGVSG
jgi:hypothetical protein